MKRVVLPLTTFAAFLALLAGCYTVPETGRRSLILVPIDQEVALGASSFTDIKSQMKVSSDPELNSRVQRVGRNIAQAVGDRLPNAKWEFVVFEDDTPNAFALPGGKVGVHTGLFEIAHTDDELAIVMGHEIAHVIARHGAERMSEGLIVTAGGIALDAALRNKESKDRDLWLASYGVAATGLVVLPHSRRGESEADNIGITYAARAGYDPRAAVTFWTRMKQAAEGREKPPEWMSTHPSDDTRIQNLERLMPDAIAEYEKARRGDVDRAPDPNTEIGR